MIGRHAAGAEAIGGGGGVPVWTPALLRPAGDARAVAKPDRAARVAAKGRGAAAERP